MVNFDSFQKQPPDFKQVSCFTVTGGEMVMSTITKNKFSQLNDKRFYFPSGAVSLPFKFKFKQKKGQKIEKYFWEEKEHLLRLENPRLYLYH